MTNGGHPKSESPDQMKKTATDQKQKSEGETKPGQTAQQAKK